MVIPRLWPHSVLDLGLGFQHEQKKHQHTDLTLPRIFKTDEFISSLKLFPPSPSSYGTDTTEQLPGYFFIWTLQKPALLNQVRTQGVTYVRGHLSFWQTTCYSSFDLLLFIWWPKMLGLNGVQNGICCFSYSLLFLGGEPIRCALRKLHAGKLKDSFTVIASLERVFMRRQTN